MVRKLSAICSILLWIFMFCSTIVSAIKGWGIPNSIYELIDEIYPSQPYEMHFAVLGILTQTISCYLIYKNSKYAIRSIVLTILVEFIPWFFIPGVDLLLNTESTLVSLSYLTYGLAAGALLGEKEASKAKILRKTRK